MSGTRWPPAHDCIRHGPGIAVRLVSTVVAALALTGCASQQIAGPALPPASLPQVAVGNSYSFDDGRTERVIGRSADLLRWRGNGDFTFATTGNVLMPRVAWSDTEARGERTISAVSGSLFPLSPGKSVAFQASRRTVDTRTGTTANVAETWQCRADGTARVTTEAGDFDTFRVSCTMTTMPSVTTLTRTFFYAPSVDYYVRREDRSSGETSVITLTGFATAEPRLPVQAARVRAAYRQTALETTPSGQSVPWTDTISGVSGTVRPVSTMRSAQRGWCRSYSETIEVSAHRYQTTGIACRTRDGTWQAIAG